MLNEKRLVEVDLGERSYPIHIGSGLLDNPALYTKHIAGRQVMVVSNETVAPIYLDRVKAALSGYQCEAILLPDGERFKTLDVWQTIFDALLQQRFNRQCTIVALGGGVVGDMAGFAAASYQRGINFIQVPTTLLAQVDSSVGGKTGVNHPLGKNMIGAFHQPLCVIADTETLNTLDDRQLSAGVAEVIKYGLIIDPEFFDWLEKNIALLLARDPQALAFAIERSCIDKAKIVAADELEAGQRALLNLGHTFGHAIETGVGYGEWLHGEAVAAGMCMAARLSVEQGWLAKTDEERIVHLMQQAGLPIGPPRGLDSDKIMGLMAVDKKVLDGKLRLVLLRGIGNAVVTDEFNQGNLQSTLNSY
ncbi:MAG: 3-dehydroquinate synthase [Gammaproteobacteria bacterium]